MGVICLSLALGAEIEIEILANWLLDPMLAIIKGIVISAHSAVFKSTTVVDYPDVPAHSSWTGAIDCGTHETQRAAAFFTKSLLHHWTKRDHIYNW